MEIGTELRYTTTHVEWISSPPASEATNGELGCWLRIATWCAHHETGYVAPGVEVSRRKPLGIAIVPRLRRWKPQAWFALYTSREEVEAMVAAGLGRWQGDDLVIFGFDTHSQQSYGRMRHDPEEPPRAPAQPPPQPPPQGRAEQSQVDLGSKGDPLSSNKGNSRPAAQPTQDEIDEINASATGWENGEVDQVAK